MVQNWKQIGPQRYRETFGRYYDDFVVGDVYEHRPGKTVLESDNHLFTLLTLNTHPLHFDAEYGNFSGGQVYNTLASSPGYVMHEFVSSVTSNPTTSPSTKLYMHWADPAGKSSTDYDFYVLDPTGKNIVAFSTNTQNGTQNAFEYTEAAAPYNFEAGSRIVIAKPAGKEDRMLNLQWFRGTLTYATSGATRGHSAAARTEPSDNSAAITFIAPNTARARSCSSGRSASSVTCLLPSKAMRLTIGFSTTLTTSALPSRRRVTSLNRPVANSVLRLRSSCSDSNGSPGCTSM